MSIKVMNAVWEESPSDRGSLLVMLALANAAQDDGVTWIDQESIARKARLTVEHTGWLLKRLSHSGEIQIRKAQRGQRRINVYWLTISGHEPDYDRMPFTLDEPFTTQDSLGSWKSDDPRSDHVTTQDQASFSGSTPLVVERKENGKGVSQIFETSEDPRAAVRIVYDHWREVCGKTRSNYDKIAPLRKQKIQARLKEFSVEELCRAIDGVARDPWEGRSLQNDLTIIFRNQEQVDRFIELAEAPGHVLTATPVKCQWAGSLGRKGVPPYMLRECGCPDCAKAADWLDAEGLTEHP